MHHAGRSSRNATALAALLAASGHCLSALPDSISNQPAPRAPTRAGPSANPDERLKQQPAQPQTSPTLEPTPDAPREWAPPTLPFNDGRGFRNLIIPIELFPGDIELIARRVVAWEEPEPTGPPTQRLILERDALLAVGDQVFTGERIAIWLRPIGLGGVGRGEGVYQLFAVIDESTTVKGLNRKQDEIDPSKLLSIQAIVGTNRPPKLRADAVIDEGRPRSGERRLLIEEGERRLAQILAPLDTQRRIARGEAPAPTPGQQQAQSNEPAGRPMFTSDGVFFISAGERVVAKPSDDTAVPEDVIQLFGGVSVQYTGEEGDLEMTATRAVVFLKPGALSGGLDRFDRESIEGFYLEGAVVASDGQYTFKSERAYYDVARNKAMVLDAVFNTFNPTLQAPMYVRAEAIRQESADQFQAERATLSSTAFFQPHISLGVRDVTIKRRPGKGIGGGDQTIVDAKGITLRAEEMPIFWFPRFRGDPERIALRTVGFTDDDRTGPFINSSWDPFALLGLETPTGVNSLIDIDHYTERGTAFGTRTQWETENTRGDLIAYFLPDDDGVDQVRSGRQFNREGDFRGFFQGRHRFQVNQYWTLIGEIAHASDEAFLQTFFNDFGSEIEETSTRLHLNRVEGDTRISIEVKGTTTDFIINENLQQSPGYQVDKLPELETVTIARDLLPESNPGLLTLNSEARFSSMRLRFSEVTPGEIGVIGDLNSQSVFGADENQSLGDRDREQGLSETFVNRFDSRQELAMTFNAGPFNINPFLTGRFTAYDNVFEDFGTQEDERYRIWGAGGVRIGTQLTRINNNIQSDAFDLYRIRHIVEPSITLWTADTTLENEDLPVYDDDVEGLNEGTAIRVALDQTWQTKRGGPGRWRDVDVLTLNTAYVNHNDTEPESTIGRFFDARPELSVPGEYFDIQAIWQATDAVAIVHETIYDVETNKADRHSTGVILDHGFGFQTRGDVRFIENQDVTYGSIQAQYEPTRKYVLDAITTYDFTNNEFQRFQLTVFRRFPYIALGVRIAVDEISDTTTFGFSLRPPTGRGEFQNQNNRRFGG